MGNEVKRATRVGEGIREELSVVLARDIRDPRVSGVIVSNVEMADDLRSGRVFVRLLAGGEDEARRKALLKGLSAAVGLLRREITQRLGLRYAPEFRFFYDEGQDHRTRVEELLAEVEAERRKRAD